MRRAAERGFLLRADSIVRDIVIPRYYDPRIRDDLAVLAESYHLATLNDLVAEGQLLHDHGNYIPKIHYGTGPFPYIRTSDLANWEVRASPKHGVSRDIFDQYHTQQDIQPEDILFVHEGTYLIGTAAIVTSFDGPMLYQHHLAKFRVLPSAPFDSFFLLAALESSIVQRQIQARQFSADIIDSVVGRLGEVIIPIPNDRQKLREIQLIVREAILGRTRIREQLTFFFRELDSWLSKESQLSLDALIEWTPNEDNYEGKTAFLGGRGQFLAFSQRADALVSNILIPKYYDPTLLEQAGGYVERCRLTSIEELEKDGILQLSTGNEIGRLNYGTGDIPFVRTSDLGSYELKANSKQGISPEVFEEYGPSQDVSVNDIFIVRDGTYLVGSSAIVFEEDLPLVYCGGIIKLRSLDYSELPPELLYGLLNTPFLRRQMRAKQFTRDVIDTLGRRLREVVLPIPKDSLVRSQIAGHIASLCHTRVQLRTKLDSFVASLYTRQSE